MRRVLFVAPSSFPLYGAESIVNLKLLLALSRSGEFEIDLISKKNKHSEYLGNSLEELGIKVSSVHIIEVDNKVSIKTIWGHFLSLLYFGVVFKGSHWAYHAIKEAKGLCKQKVFDFVLTKNSPSLLVGYYLKKRLNLKWIATWNDPYPEYLYPEIYARYMHAKKDWASDKQIRILRKYVDVHVFPNSRLRDYLLKYYKVDFENTRVIPHVVIGDAIHHSGKNDETRTLRIVHSGNISYPRDPESFMVGLRKFLNKYQEASIVVDVIGVKDESFTSKVEKYKLDGIVKGLPPMSYLESMNRIQDYHICLIVEADVPEGIFLPTKVSDFMQKNMPIMAVSPKDGVLHDLYLEKNIGYFANVSDPLNIAQTLEKLYFDFMNNNLVSSRVPTSYMEDSVVKNYMQI